MAMSIEMAAEMPINERARIDDLVSSGAARQLRIDAGHTLAMAANVVEVDPGAVHKWERAERRPRGRNVRAYLRYLERLQAAA